MGKRRGSCRWRNNNRHLAKRQRSRTTDEWVINCTETLLQAARDMVMCIAVPLWELIRFLCYDAWKEENATKGNKENKTVERRHCPAFPQRK